MEKLLIIYKWGMSFLKSDWTIDDYPVRFKEQGKDDPTVPRWYAQIINWWVLTGLGETKDEAYRKLSENLLAAREHRGQLPRPGTGLPIDFESGNELEKNWGIASRIIGEVLGFDPEGIFVSDGSSLWDFCENDDITEYQRRVKDIFGIDVSHI